MAKKKRPKDMTTEEAMRHLFTARGANHIKKHAAKLDRKKLTKKG